MTIRFEKFSTLAISLLCLCGAMAYYPSVSVAHTVPDAALQKVSAGSAAYKRSVKEYQIPDVVLTDYDEHQVRLRDLMATKDPLILNFVFTTCSTICPVTTKVLSEVPAKLGQEGSRLRMISISIDPENDTPLQLKAYARTFQAGERWKFLTGRPQDVKAVLFALESYRGDKMNHEPVTLMRQPLSKAWVRIDGFATPDELVREYRKTISQ
jgi:protein SCO1/2